MCGITFTLLLFRLSLIQFLCCNLFSFTGMTHLLGSVCLLSLTLGFRQRHILFIHFFGTLCYLCISLCITSQCISKQVIVLFLLLLTTFLRFVIVCVIWCIVFIIVIIINIIITITFPKVVGRGRLVTNTLLVRNLHLMLTSKSSFALCKALRICIFLLRG